MRSLRDMPDPYQHALEVSIVRTCKSPFGQVSRIGGSPANPRTPSQMEVRITLSRVAARWRALAEVQRTAWMAAAKDAKSNSRLSQSGSLSGFQLFVKINCTLSQFGEAQVDAPPERPQFPDLAPASLSITNTGGVAALKLGCPRDPGANTIIRGCKPVSQGRETCRDFRILGMCPAAVQGSADITSLYAARFGAPPAGKKVYIQVNQFVAGWEDLPVTFSAIVPAGT